MPEHGGVAPAGVRALDNVIELLRVAHEYEVAGCRPHGQRVGERDLTRLVDEEVVERLLVLRAREEPRRPGREVTAAAGAGVGDVLDQLRAVVERLGVAPARLL